MIWTGFVMSVVFTVVFDALSLASWLAIPKQIVFASRPILRVSLVPTCIFVAVRTAVNILSLIVSSKLLDDIMGHHTIERGIFYQLFGYIVYLARMEQIPTRTSLNERRLDALGNGNRLGQV